jgi:hypothetical protein
LGAVYESDEWLEPCYEGSWEECLKDLGLTGDNFGYFWAGTEKFLRQYPDNPSTDEVPEGEGIRMYSTLEGIPDLPALYVYYYVERPRIIFLGASHAWSQTDLPPE